MLKKAIDWSKKKRASDRESNSDRGTTGNNDQVWEEVPATGPCVHFTNQTATSTSSFLLDNQDNQQPQTSSPPASGQDSIISNILSQSQAVPGQEFTIQGKTYRRVSQTARKYSTHNASQDTLNMDLDISLVDRGCNGGFLGEDALILGVKENTFADIVGMNDSIVKRAPIGTGCLKINTNQGPVIPVFHQYALGGKGLTIHSAL